MAENVPETPKRNNLIDTGKLGVFDELLKASNKGVCARATSAELQRGSEEYVDNPQAVEEITQMFFFASHLKQ